ncbi:DUF2206 domain-containing protein [Natrinema versiforme]|uniref:Transmembrane protein n=1 Tax=Natrinema versiforme JCM 10478 TaxID=1227496 RepID=L9Y0P3_9EURY|nr:DUF2206 domain-containing protein [Natrinema versiforme]ELY67292.1 transmembrane protein [Natrinema versiforme JCM 10478]
MTYAPQTSGVSFDWGPTTVTTVVFALLIGFWSSVGLESIGVELPAAQAVFGVVLLTVVPGGLLTQLLGLRTTSVGEFGTIALGLSLVVLSITTVLASVLLPVFGVPEPLSFLPLAVIVTALIAVLTLLILVTDGNSFHVRVPFSNSLPIYAVLGFLPVFAVLGALLMNRYGNNVGLGLFVLSVAVVTLLSATRVIQPSQYPVVVFSVALSTLLHRSLASGHVVGADIQFTYYLSELFASNHQWAPALGGSMSSVPIVTAVPVAYSMVTGLELVTIFTVVYPIIFAVVPLGIYSLAADVFDGTVGLYASLFFVFYHGTFYLTPGKQRLSELFIVGALLLYFRHESRDRGWTIGMVLLATGLVHSHYGSTYVFGLSLLAASIGLVLTERLVGEFRHGLSPIYPLAFLVGATSWYAYASSELTASLASIPIAILDQLASLPGGTAAGSGSSYVQTQQTIFQQVSLGLYLLLSLLICLGLVWQTVSILNRLRQGIDTRYVEFTALALPLCAFLGMSYFLVLDLWADRVYQMVLPVLAVFAAVGYLRLGTTAERIPGISSVNWTPLAVVLAALFVINSGFAGAAAGVSADYTFNDEAHDYAFSDEEREAAQWLADQPEIERTAADGGAEEEAVVPIYTDRISSQLFRSIVPMSHYNVEVIMVKNQWDPTFEPADTRGGYVFIRHNAVDDSAPDDTPLSSLSADHVNEITENRTIVYENEDVTIVEPVGGGAANATADES